MREVVIVGGVRTAIGNHGGAFRITSAQELAKTVIGGVLEQLDLQPEIIDDVILGCINQGSDAPNIARVAALMAGVPDTVPGFTVQRNCASGLQSISSAYQAIQAGDGEVFVVGGTESMSCAPHIVRGARWGLNLRHTTFIDTIWEGLTDPICGLIMGRTAENLAERYGISREDQDAFAVESHRKALLATRMAKFREEIVPVPVTKGVEGQEVVREEVVEDECINPALTLEKAALYPAVLKENGTVTPANACPIADGAAALVVMTAEKARALGLRPWAYIRSYAYAGVPPEVMGIGPAKAVPRALARAGLVLDDIDLIELHEALAAQVLAVGRELERDGWDWRKVNVNGGAIALGHPAGCTGARMMVTLLREMMRRDVQFGLVTLSVGGGQGGAMVVERR